VFLIVLVIGFGVIVFMIAGLYGKLDQLSTAVNALRAEMKRQNAAREAEDAVTDA
jgi:cell division protein FtsB